MHNRKFWRDLRQSSLQYVSKMEDPLGLCLKNPRLPLGGILHCRFVSPFFPCKKILVFSMKFLFWWIVGIDSIHSYPHIHSKDGLCKTITVLSHRSCCSMGPFPLHGSPGSKDHQVFCHVWEEDSRSPVSQLHQRPSALTQMSSKVIQILPNCRSSVCCWTSVWFLNFFQHLFFSFQSN